MVPIPIDRQPTNTKVEAGEVGEDRRKIISSGDVWRTDVIC